MVNHYKSEMGTADLDVTAVVRMYNYVGHAIRQSMVNPNRLVGQLLKDRSKPFCRRLEEQTPDGRQGHARKFSPWTYEFQIDDFFHQNRLNWIEVAQNKGLWTGNRPEYLKYYVQNRRNVNFGKWK